MVFASAFPGNAVCLGKILPSLKLTFFGHLKPGGFAKTICRTQVLLWCLVSREDDDFCTFEKGGGPQHYDRDKMGWDGALNKYTSSWIFFILISGVVSPYFSSSPPPPLRRLPVQSAIQRELATPEDKMYLAMGLATLNDHFFCLGIENFWKKTTGIWEKSNKKNLTWPEPLNPDWLIRIPYFHGGIL